MASSMPSNFASIAKFVLAFDPRFARGALQQIGAAEVHLRRPTLQAVNEQIFGGARDGSDAVGAWPE